MGLCLTLTLSWSVNPLHSNNTLGKFQNWPTFPHQKTRPDGRSPLAQASLALSLSLSFSQFCHCILKLLLQRENESKRDRERQRSRGRERQREGERERESMYVVPVSLYLCWAAIPQSQTQSHSSHESMSRLGAAAVAATHLCVTGWESDRVHVWERKSER